MALPLSSDARLSTWAPMYSAQGSLALVRSTGGYDQQYLSLPILMGESAYSFKSRYSVVPLLLVLGQIV